MYWYWPYHRWHDHARGVGCKVISEEVGLVIPIETLRSQCEIVPIDQDSDNIDSDNPNGTHPDDDLLRGYLAAAVDYAEGFTGLSIKLRTYELALDCFPWNQGAIQIPIAPMNEIISFLGLGAGSDGEMDEGDNYIIDDYRNPPQLLPVGPWPSVIRSTNAIKVRFTAGYSEEDSTATEMPPSVKQALLLLVAHFYENRSDTVEKALSTIPNGVNSLLGFKRIRLGMA